MATAPVYIGELLRHCALPAGKTGTGPIPEAFFVGISHFFVGVYPENSGISNSTNHKR